MIRISLAPLMVALLLSGLSGRAADAPRPMQIPKTDHPPRINGRLNDDAWKSAARTGPFVRLGTEKAADARTEAYVCTDGRWLFIGIVCEGGGAAGRVSVEVEDRPDDGVPAREKVEVALRPVERKLFAMHVPVTRLGERQVLVSLRDVKTGEVIQQSAISGLDRLTPLRAYLDRNYYMRAEKEGTYASMVLCNMAHNAPITKQGIAKRFALSKGWQRCHVTCTYPETGWTMGMRPEMTFFLINQGVECGIWVDAVQLEEGPEPTIYPGREVRRSPRTPLPTAGSVADLAEVGVAGGEVDGLHLP